MRSRDLIDPVAFAVTQIGVIHRPVVVVILTAITIIIAVVMIRAGACEFGTGSGCGGPVRNDSPNSAFVFGSRKYSACNYSDRRAERQRRLAGRTVSELLRPVTPGTPAAVSPATCLAVRLKTAPRR